MNVYDNNCKNTPTDTAHKSTFYDYFEKKLINFQSDQGTFLNESYIKNNKEVKCFNDSKVYDDLYLFDLGDKSLSEIYNMLGLDN